MLNKNRRATPASVKTTMAAYSGSHAIEEAVIPGASRGCEWASPAESLWGGGAGDVLGDGY